MDYIFLVAASLLWLMVEAATAVVVLSPCAVRGGGTRGNSRAFRMQCQRLSGGGNSCLKNRANLRSRNINQNPSPNGRLVIM